MIKIHLLLEICFLSFQLLSNWSQFWNFQKMNRSLLPYVQLQRSRMKLIYSLRKGFCKVLSLLMEIVELNFLKSKRILILLLIRLQKTMIKRKVEKKMKNSDIQKTDFDFRKFIIWIKTLSLNTFLNLYATWKNILISSNQKKFLLKGILLKSQEIWSER